LEALLPPRRSAMKKPRPPQYLLTWAIVACLSLALVSTTFGEVIKLGIPPAMEDPISCDPTGPLFEVELNPRTNVIFDLIVRNCSGVAAEAVVLMAYSTPPNSVPPGDPATAEHYPRR